MIKALKNLASTWYTPLSERGNTVSPTRFLIRPLDGIERLGVNYARDDFGNFSLPSESARAALKHGLQGWENFMDDDGSPVQYVPGDRDMNLRRLPAELVAELTMEIWVSSVLTEEERKNSSSLPTSRPSSGAPSTAAPADGAATATSATPLPSSNGASPG